MKTNNNLAENRLFGGEIDLEDFNTYKPNQNRIRKLFIQTTSQKKLNCRQFREPDLWNPENNGSYHGATHWQNYCWYMNDVLRVIRKGDKDYCYFIYQVMELARFHFHELKTKYIPQYKCWEVWLDL